MSQIANRLAEPKTDILHVLGATYLSAVLLMCPRTTSKHDLLDADIATWTAECVANGEVSRQFDSRGIRMEIAQLHGL